MRTSTQSHLATILPAFISFHVSQEGGKQQWLHLHRRAYTWETGGSEHGGKNPNEVKLKYQEIFIYGKAGSW